MIRKGELVSGREIILIGMWKVRKIKEKDKNQLLKIFWKL